MVTGVGSGVADRQSGRAVYSAGELAVLGGWCVRRKLKLPSLIGTADVRAKAGDGPLLSESRRSVVSPYEDTSSGDSRRASTRAYSWSIPCPGRGYRMASDNLLHGDRDGVGAYVSAEILRLRLDLIRPWRPNSNPGFRQVSRVPDHADEV